MIKGNKRVKLLLFLVVVSMLLKVGVVRADEASTENEIESSKERYYIGEVVNTGKDNGYSGSKKIKEDDPHYGWKLGEFYIEGFTRYEFDEDGNVVFLKNVGDEVKLWFDLQQNINKLNGSKYLSIYEDENGYYEKFNIEKTNFKKGALIIRYTDYQNKVGEPQIYTNYLSAKVSKDADTEVLLCEEGDYEVSLLYEIFDDGFLFFNSYTNYRIDFKFSVRNGNTMIFPFDVVTGNELSNSAFTSNGFYLDLANSRYLKIDIKKEVLKDGVDGLVEDVRFNRPAADGETYTEEGIYTITATNQYTNVTTEKKIYVGNDSVLKAHVVTGVSIEEIEMQVENGATITEEGQIIPAEKKETENDNLLYKIIIVVGVVAVCVGIVFGFVVKKRRKNLKAEHQIENDIIDNK